MSRYYYDARRNKSAVSVPKPNGGGDGRRTAREAEKKKNETNVIDNIVFQASMLPLEHGVRVAALAPVDRLFLHIIAPE